MADQSVAELVVGGDLALLLGEQARLLLRPGDHAHDPFLELLLLDDLLAAAGGEQGGLVDEVRKVGAREAGRAGGERVEIDLGRDRLALRVNLEDLPAADAVGPVDDDLTVEAARAQQGGVEDVGPVRRRDQNDVVLQLEPVHLDEQLVEGLLTLVVASAESGTAVAADCVDLVHEDDAGGGLLGLLEEVADARGADADEHLDEVGAGDREERHSRLAGAGAREKRLTRARRPIEQHALWNPRSEGLELLGILEELLDLVQFFDGLVHSRHVLEADLRRVRRHPLGAALAEAHYLRAAALNLVHQEDPEGEQEHERQQRGEEADPGPVASALRVVLDAVLVERRLDAGHGLVGRVVDGVLLAVPQLAADLPLAGVELRAADLAGVDVLAELRVGDLLGVLPVGNQRLARQVDEQHDYEQ